MAVNKEILADEVLDGFFVPATGGFVPPATPGHSPTIGLPYDPARARQLMTQAGYPNGHGFPSLEIIWHRPDILEPLLAQWLDNLNINVAIEIADWENVVQAILGRDIFCMGWQADYPDPDSFLRVAIPSHIPNWKNATYDRLLEEAQRSSNQKDRIRFYREADKILIEDAVVIPYLYEGDHFLCKPWVKLPEWSDFFRFKDVILEPH
jgi:oligopeptide transport system substrate-binding protein